MEFPRSNQTPGFHPGSVSQGAFSVPNSNPRPSDFFGRKAGLEAGSQGVMALNALDLGGGGDDGRRGFKPISVAPGGVSSNMSFGQRSYSGVTAVNPADSDIMLSLDDILNDLHKKVVSGNNNPRPVGFVSGRPKTQENMHGGAVADLPERNEQSICEVAFLHETERNKAPHGGFFSFPGVNEQDRDESAGSHNQHEGEVAGPQGKSGLQQESKVVHLQDSNEGGFFTLRGVNEQDRGGSAGSHNQHEGEVAGLQGKSGHQQESEVVHLQVANEGGFFTIRGVNEQDRGESAGSHNQHEGEVAVPQGKSGHQLESEVVHLQVANEPSGQYSTNEHHHYDEAAVIQGEGTLGSPHDNDKSKGETTASAGGIHDQRKSELPEPSGTNDQEKAEGVQRTREAENLQQAESDMALEMVGGGELQPFLGTPRRGRQVSRKPVEIIDSPDWLPKGWCTEQRTREAGSSAGTKDKYYYDPVSQRRFRSKTEVLSYLETGKVGRYKSKIKPEADATRKRNTSEVLLKNLSSLDPNIRPTKVRWVYDDFDSTWIPFVNEKDLNGYNNKEGEHNFDLNHNSGDACKE